MTYKSMKMAQKIRKKDSEKQEKYSDKMKLTQIWKKTRENRKRTQKSKKMTQIKVHEKDSEKAKNSKNIEALYKRLKMKKLLL